MLREELLHRIARTGAMLAHDEGIRLKGRDRSVPQRQ